MLVRPNYVEKKHKPRKTFCTIVETVHPFSQAFSQTLQTGCPEGMFSHTIVRDQVNFPFIYAWASIGQLYTLLAKTLLSALAVSYNENFSGLTVILGLICSFSGGAEEEICTLLQSYYKLAFFMTKAKHDKMKCLF